MSKERIGSIKDHTPNYKLIIPRFDLATWHDYIEENFRNIDALFFNLFGINNYSGAWKQITEYKQGQVLFIGEDLDINGKVTDFSGRLIKVLKDHVTDNSDYFNIFYNLHPDYYELFFDANNAEYFASKAFEYKNEANNYLKASQDLNTTYQQYLADTKTARDDAQISANSAATSEQNAKTASNTAVNAVKTATDLLNSTQDYTNQAIDIINTTKTDAVNTITTTKEQTVQEIDTKLEETNQIIDEKITIVQDNLDTTITEAIIAAKDEVQEEADKAIENAAEKASDFAKDILDDYVVDTIEPSLQHFVDEAKTAQNNAITAQNSAQTNAIACANSATKALSSENNAKTYENSAEGFYNNAKEQADLAKNSADLAQEALKSITGVYRVKGSVESYTNLPISGDVGDVYNVLDTGSNYVWTEDGWDKLSETVDVSWGSISGTLSNQTDLQQALDNKVNLTDNQTIGGYKTFTLPITVSGGNTTIYVRNTQIQQGVNPSENFATYPFYVIDKNDKLLCYASFVQATSGDVSLGLNVRNQSGSSTGSLKVGYDSDGNLYTSAPTPASTNNSTQIATTAWVNTRLGGTDITSTELGYLDGATSNIQTQLNNTIKTSGNQTWTGVKTAKHSNIQVQCSVADDTATSISANEERGLLIVDKDGARIGNFFGGQLASGKIRTYMCATRNVSGTNKHQYAEIQQNTDGTGTFNIACTTAVSPTPAVADNSTKIATTAFVNNFQPAVTALSNTSGTVSLAVNKIYTISVSGTTTFKLPTPSNTNIFNQIKLMLKVTGTPTINWGTTRFFNKKTPEIKAGNYDVYFDYDKLMSVWVCGVIAKGTAS